MSASSPLAVSCVGERRLEALPAAALGAAFLLTWIVPQLLGAQMLRFAALTMVMEFIVIHSAAFMLHALTGDGPKARRVVAMIVLGVAYTALLAGFCFAFGSWWPVLSFAVLIAMRIAVVFESPRRQQMAQQRFGREWASACVLYVAWMVATGALPIPALGITDAVVQAAQVPGSGLWVDEPQTAVVAGSGYFLMQAWLHWTGRELLPAAKPAG